MYRTRAARKSNYRNPNNLRVISTAGRIPTGCVMYEKPVQQQSAVTTPTMQLISENTYCNPAVIPVVPSPNSFNPNPVNSPYLPDKFKRRRRNRGKKKQNQKPFAAKNVNKTSQANLQANPVTQNPNFRWFNRNNLKKSNVTDDLEKTNVADDSKKTNNVADDPGKTNNAADDPEKKVTEKVIVKVPEVPTPAEDDFEEVEVASSEGDAKRIPVGFRKTKLHYLNYKHTSFFKPKFYDFSSQRIVVNCLNIADDVSVDCDVISEAEYDECEIDNLEDPLEKFGNILEIEDDEMTDEADYETDQGVNNEMLEDSVHVITDETEESSHAVSDEANEEPVHVVSDEVNEEPIPAVSDEANEELIHAISDEADEESTHAVTNKEDKKKSTHTVSDKEAKKSSVATAVVGKKSVANELGKRSSSAATNEVNKKSADDVISKKGKEKLSDNKELTASKTRAYKSCIEENDDVIQRKSLIQDKLDTWESHLIGLEYLLEICDKNKTSVLKYYCVLCDEELNVQEFPEAYVINHISGSNHVTKYLEKHFPSCDFKCNENSSYDFALFQKLCEKINEKLGYYFMCSTNIDYYSKNKSKIKEIIQNASHPSDVNFKFERDTFEKTVDSDLSENIHLMIEDVIKKVIPKNEITTEMEGDKKINKSKSEDKLIDKSMKNKPDPKPEARKPKYKGNNSVSAFLRLNFAANTKLKLPSNTNKNKKTNSDVEQVVKSVKSQDGVKETVKSVSNQIGKSSKTVIKKVQPKDIVIETITIEDDDDSDNVESMDVKLNEEQLDTKKPEDEAKSFESATDNSSPVESHEVVSDAVTVAANNKVTTNKEKVLLKTTIHSKHCRKRILDNGMARLRLAASKTAKKTVPKARLVTEVSKNSNVKSKSVTPKVNNDAPKKISKKIKPELKESKIAVTPIKKKLSHKVVSAQKSPTVETRSPVTTAHLSSHQKKSVEHSSSNKGSATGNDSSKWIPMRASSPILTSDISLFLKKIAVVTSDSGPKRRISKSPPKRITSPLRLETKIRPRRHSKSPHRNSDSKSPVRRRSRSPYRKLSKSPLRRSRSPIRRRSRSPQRRRSRSPVRRRSRSPRRRSRSPVRHRSRSPFRRHSRSPGRRSRSPLRKLSRSPVRRYSRSPLRRLSRSPLRRLSRSPIRRRSRSPVRRHSRSPIKRRSRSPFKRHAKSPVKSFSNNSFTYRNLQQVSSSNISQPGSSREYYSPDEHYQRNAFNFSKHSDVRESEIARSRDKLIHPSRINKSDRYKSQTLPSAPSRGIMDLDPVSDEDESVYFTDKCDVSSSSSKGMLSKLIQKFSAPDTSGEQGLNNLLQIMGINKAELEEFIASKSAPKAEKLNTMKIDPNLQQQTLLLQQLLLSNLASSMQGSAPSVPNLQYAPQQSFLPENAALRFGHPSVNLQAPVNIPPVPPQPAQMQPRFFPPNTSVPPPHVPPPQLFQQPQPQPQLQPQPQPMQNFPPKPKPATEVIFKDLKATVSKLFGANESVMKQNIKPQMSSFVTNQIPDPEKWDLNHPNAPKFNVSLSPQKNAFPLSGKSANFSDTRENSGMRDQVSSRDTSRQFLNSGNNERSQNSNVPPPDAKVTFCDSPRNSAKTNLFPVVNPNFSASSTRGGVNDVKVSLAQRLASVLVKIGMVDVPAPLLQEMLMKIGAFSSSPRQDISENEILSILKKLGYLS